MWLATATLKEDGMSRKTVTTKMGTMRGRLTHQ